MSSFNKMNSIKNNLDLSFISNSIIVQLQCRYMFVNPKYRISILTNYVSGQLWRRSIKFKIQQEKEDQELKVKVGNLSSDR
jgi:hypothetical protein